MRTTLVTGGAGFVGTNMADRLLSQGERVVVLDDLSRVGVENNLSWLRATHPDRLQVEVGDVQDAAVVRRALQDVDQVFHFAAQVAVTTSVTDPVADYGVNLGGTMTLLEELRRLDDAPPLLFTSTNKVYGKCKGIEVVERGDRYEPSDETVRTYGIGEDQPLQFASPYGCSKGGADQYVLDYAKTFGLPAVVFRMSCIYGPHQHGNEDQGWVAHFAIRALEGLPITLYGDGAQVRDILFVEDLVEAMQQAQAQADRLAGTPFNMGGGPTNAVSLLEVVETMESLGLQVRFRRAEERPGDQRYYVADTTRFADATGWRPDVDAQEGIERMVRWLADQRAPQRQRLRAVAL